LKSFGLEPDGVRLVEPLDYLSFLQLEQKARLILTDSGGVQEEACILGVPCVTLRDNTERPETLDVGANVLAGTIPSRIVDKTKLMLNCDAVWANPFGDGTAGERIVQLLMENSA
jgi:UDP-N-acetylglucosamine 2-epimerase (non-hydrolysing)